MNKLVLHSGGMDSLALMIEAIEKYGADNVISLGFKYGQRHYNAENKAAFSFCDKHKIKRYILNADISQIGGCSLVDTNIDVTTDMTQQRSTVVPMRNSIFLMYAAAFAQVHQCDVILHGACAEDFQAYRDCRPEFFGQINIAIQAGLTAPIKGSENIREDMIDGKILVGKCDIEIETPLIFEKKEETLARILLTHPLNVYEDSYSCYNGVIPQCGRCPACIERKHAFDVVGVKDPVPYAV